MQDGTDGKTLFFEFIRNLNKANNFSKNDSEIRGMFEGFVAGSGNREELIQIFNWMEKTRPKNRLRIREYCDSLVEDIDSGIL